MNILEIAIKVLEEECNKKCPHGIDCEDDVEEVKKIKIKGHTSVADKRKAKQYRMKNKKKLERAAKKKKKKQAKCPPGKVYSNRQKKCIKPAVTVGLQKRN